MIVDKSVLTDLSEHRYTISIAKTEDEVEEALRLRYEIFYNELDRDKYDLPCHHLIVKENKRKQIIGTYRLQTYEMAEAGEGFYSDSYYKLNEFPDSILKQSFEVGRACIDEKHRNGRVLYLLWKGFAGYLRYYKKRYLIGSLGIPAKDKSEASSVYNYFKNDGKLNDEFLINARIPYRFDLDEKFVSMKSGFEVPPLLQNYLSIGCRVCSEPAYHQEMKLLYIMIFLDTETITPRVRKMFFE
ncbi:MAG: GNAT family N-acetyltransferase [Balneolaceae bacterium]